MGAMNVDLGRLSRLTTCSVPNVWGTTFIMWPCPTTCKTNYYGSGRAFPVWFTFTLCLCVAFAYVDTFQLGESVSPQGYCTTAKSSTHCTPRHFRKDQTAFRQLHDRLYELVNCPRLYPLLHANDRRLLLDPSSQPPFFNLIAMPP